MREDAFIETPRLRFRPWADADAPVLFRYAYCGDERPVKIMKLHPSMFAGIRDIFVSLHR